VPLVHHELCFGCGRTNLFGLLLELEMTEPGAVAGRCFIKQDHQGPDRGNAHDGIVGAALCEAMALACGADARAEAFEVSLESLAPVGAFLEVEARAERRDGPIVHATATATAEQRVIARARGSYRS
jgi:acyl-coenzyme A thioesterase PaaI-like protein